MKWVTRERAQINGVACPCLVKKFVDSKAKFLFLPAEKATEVAKEEREPPFDVANAEPGPHDEASFNTFIEKYQLRNDVAPVELAKIAMGAHSHKFGLIQQSAGLDAIAEGFRQIYVYSGLYAAARGS